MADETHPRTHRWYKNQRPGARSAPEPERLQVTVPSGAMPDHGAVAQATLEALKDWPIVILKLVGTADAAVRVGRHPGRWLRKHIGHSIDAGLCSCGGPRCHLSDCKANRLIGRHAITSKPDAEAWAPLVVRAANTDTGKIKIGQPLRCELVFAGAASISALPDLLELLQGAPEAPPNEPSIQWNTIQYLSLDEDGEPRWRKASPDTVSSAQLALDRITEPAIRPSRLVVTFLSSTPLGRRHETGLPNTDLALIVDRMGRSLGAWMGRTGHRGPRLPIDDLLRCAGACTLVADNTTVVRVTSALLGSSGSQDEEGPEEVPALLGSITFKGQFEGLTPMLRAVSYLGMGPGRQHGLGQVTVR